MRKLFEQKKIFLFVAILGELAKNKVDKIALRNFFFRFGVSLRKTFKQMITDERLRSGASVYILKGN